MNPLPAKDLLENLHWRYATKVFDPAKPIAPETWSVLEESLRLTPSSYGLQPWKFLIVTDAAMKRQLRPHAWNQSQVTDCSHFVIFASRTTIDSAYIDAFIEATAGVRAVTADSLKVYRDMIVEDIVHGARSGVAAEWAARQAYIALGGFMTLAAQLHIDACPMEGFEPAEFDRILGLTAQGLTATVCCAAGHRSEADKYAHLGKVRFCAEQVIARL